jgi:hypothetical protein
MPCCHQFYLSRNAPPWERVTIGPLVQEYQGDRARTRREARRICRSTAS